jgi:hypothetical protein
MKKLDFYSERCEEIKVKTNPEESGYHEGDKNA